MGSCFVAFSTIPNYLDRCTGYKTSPRVTRYFCSSCGTHCFVDGFEDVANPEGWRVNSGCIEEADGPGSSRAGKKDIINVQYHGYVGDTGDGGIAGWLKSIGGRKVPAYDQTGETKEAKEIDVPVPKTGASDPAAAKQDDKLLVECHCGGVQFHILRSKTEPSEDRRWLQANGTKYQALFCVCRSCRLGIGQPLQPWTYVEKQDLETMDGNPMDFDKLGTLKQYESSPGIHHDFCGRCGATVFYRSVPRRERHGYDVVDISVGLLRSKAGSRAEDWLQWDLSWVSWRSDALDEELIDALLESGKTSKTQ